MREPSTKQRHPQDTGAKQRPSQDTRQRQSQDRKQRQSHETTARQRQTQDTDGGRQTYQSQDSGTKTGRSTAKTGRDSKKKDSRSSTGKIQGQNLEQDLEEQLKYRDTVAWSVGVLEQSVAELELQLDSLTKGSTDEADTEFKLRYDAQRALNEKLQEQTGWYSLELDKTKDRFRQAQQRASYNLTTLCQEYSYDADLDQYSEAELSVMVRQLERERNISYSEFRNKTWLLDSRSKIK